MFSCDAKQLAHCNNALLIQAPSGDDSLTVYTMNARKQINNDSNLFSKYDDLKSSLIANILEVLIFSCKLLIILQDLLRIAFILSIICLSKLFEINFD